MRVTVTDDCVGTAQCVAVAPDVFELNEDGLAQLKEEPTDAASMNAANEAADLCPMAAIKIDS